MSSQGNHYVARLDELAERPADPGQREHWYTQRLALHIEEAERVLNALMDAGRAILISWSSGKDSSALANLILTTAAKRRWGGHLYIVHSDTGIENPEIVLYARGEMDRIRQYADQHGLNVDIHVVGPTAANDWVNRVIGGKEMPVFANTSQRRCSTNYKRVPIQNKLNDLSKRTDANGLAPVNAIGTRFDESAVRNRNMTGRGEIHTLRHDEGTGEDRLSLICHWTTDDVWRYLIMAGTGYYDAYSDFEDTERIYKDAAGASCSIVADKILGKQNPGGCGSRHGCWGCTAVGVDKSMVAMVEGDARYQYMRGLNRLQRFLIATQYDLDRRTWVGRTLVGPDFKPLDGRGLEQADRVYVKVQPDGYSPAMLRELLRYLLTIDAREQEAAHALGIKPRFQVVPAQQLISIDVYWAQYGHATQPFEALRIWDEVYHQGKRYDVPDLETVKPVAIPAPRFIDITRDWQAMRSLDPLMGIRSPLMEMHEGKDCIGTITVTGNRPHTAPEKIRDDVIMMDFNTARTFEVSVEGAYNLIDYERDDLLAQPFTPGDHACAMTLTTYLHYGVVAIPKSQRRKMDDIARRTTMKHRLGLTGDVDVRALIDRSQQETYYRTD